MSGVGTRSPAPVRQTPSSSSSNGTQAPGTVPTWCCGYAQHILVACMFLPVGALFSASAMSLDAGSLPGAVSYSPLYALAVALPFGFKWFYGIMVHLSGGPVPILTGAGSCLVLVWLLQTILLFVVGDIPVEPKNVLFLSILLFAGLAQVSSGVNSALMMMVPRDMRAWALVPTAWMATRTGEAIGIAIAGAYAYQVRWQASATATLLALVIVFVALVMRRYSGLLIDPSDVANKDPPRVYQVRVWYEQVWTEYLRGRGMVHRLFMPYLFMYLIPSPDVALSAMDTNWVGDSHAARIISETSGYVLAAEVVGCLVYILIGSCYDSCTRYTALGENVQGHQQAGLSRRYVGLFNIGIFFRALALAVGCIIALSAPDWVDWWRNLGAVAAIRATYAAAQAMAMLPMYDFFIRHTAENHVRFCAYGLVNSLTNVALFVGVVVGHLLSNLIVDGDSGRLGLMLGFLCLLNLLLIGYARGVPNLVAGDMRALEAERQGSEQERQGLTFEEEKAQNSPRGDMRPLSVTGSEPKAGAAVVPTDGSPSSAGTGRSRGDAPVTVMTAMGRFTIDGQAMVGRQSDGDGSDDGQDYGAELVN